MPTLRTALVICSIVSIIGAAAAQNALDPQPRNAPRQRGAGRQGNALDANLGVGTGRSNSAAPQQNFNARNLIVTRNVAGGRGFRGSVGYLAAGDFAAPTAGDSQWQFRSNAAISSPEIVSNTRSGDRFQMAQELGILEYRRFSSPSDPAASAGQVPGLFRLDRASSQLTAARLIERSAEPVPFASGQDRAQRDVQFAVSGVQGLRMRRMDDPLNAAELSTFETARARQEVAAGSLRPERVAAPFVTPLATAVDLRQDPRSDQRTDHRIDGQRVGGSTGRSSYDEIVQRIVQRYADDPTVRIDADPRAIERARTELDRLRAAIGAAPSGAKRPTEADSKLPLPGDPPDPLDPATPALNRARENPDAASSSDPGDQKEADRSRDDAARREAIDSAARALRHGMKVGDLAPGERVRVDELVREGQLNLERGEYFRAERSFNSALELNPGNPMLLAGLANTQIGGGLYLSGALTLRVLFSENPEMIDTRYEARLLPNETRLRFAIETLRTRIGRGSDADGYGLTLAYLGHQMSNRALVEEGLQSLTGSEDNDLLRELLSKIWLSESAPEKP